MKGVKETQDKLRKKQKEIDLKIHNITESRLRAVLFEAQRDAPVDMAHLKQSGGFEMGKREGKVFFNAKYAPFVEFGTKTKVKVPKGFEKLAIQYKGIKDNRPFQDFKNDVYEWAKRKGIPEKAWYFVLMKIIKVGINPNPFLIPPYIKHRTRYKKEVKDYIDAIQW